MSLKKQLGELDAKLKALRLSIKKCDEIIEKRDKQTIERQCISVASLARELDKRLDPRDQVFSGRVRRASRNLVRRICVWQMIVRINYGRVKINCQRGKGS